MSAKTREPTTIPRWVLPAMLAVGFLAMQDEFWSWDFPRELSALGEALSWTMAVFPHALAFPIGMAAPGGAPVTLAILAALDLALCALIWRTQPARLSPARFTTILGVWILLSAVTTFAAPSLMSWTWRATH